MVEFSHNLVATNRLSKTTVAATMASSVDAIGCGTLAEMVGTAFGG